MIILPRACSGLALGPIIDSMAPSADEAYVHEHCKVLAGLPIVLDTAGLLEEIEQADHLFARFANSDNPRLTLHNAAQHIGALQPLNDAVAQAAGGAVSSDKLFWTGKGGFHARHSDDGSAKFGGGGPPCVLCRVDLFDILISICVLTQGLRRACCVRHGLYRCSTGDSLHRVLPSTRAPPCAGPVPGRRGLCDGLAAGRRGHWIPAWRVSGE